MSLNPLLLLGAVPVAALATALWARDQARRDRERRARLLRRGALGLAIGVAVAWGSWYVLPTNRESPAMLLTYFVSWIGGGGTILLSAALTLGAWSGHRVASSAATDTMGRERAG